MTCKQFERLGATELEGGHRQPRHLLKCRRCRSSEAAYRSVGQQLSNFKLLPPSSGQPLPDWEARVWARIARQPVDSSVLGFARLRRFALAGFVAAFVLFGSFAVDTQIEKQRVNTAVRAEMETVATQVDQRLARLDVVEAEADVRYQLIHVAYARARAARPGAVPRDLMLASAREGALAQLQQRHRLAVVAFESM